MEKMVEKANSASKLLAVLAGELQTFHRGWKQMKTDYENLVSQVVSRKAELVSIRESIRTAYTSQEEQIAKLFKQAEEKSAAADEAKFKADRALDEARKSRNQADSVREELENDRAAFGVLVAQSKEAQAKSQTKPGKSA